jgi:hypothetical protein
LDHAIEQLRVTRTSLVRVIQEMSVEQMLVVPEGFRNNVLWNLGHIVVSQQGLQYRLSGLPLYVSPEQVAQFRRGSDPSTWESIPDVALLERQLLELPERLLDDYRAGRFTEYAEYTTSAGATLRSIDDAIAFNNYHEGYHTGIISALRRLVT